jgi:putative inorganic carbon (hco3(-)) transporter
MVSNTRHTVRQVESKASFPFALYALWVYQIVAVGRLGEIIPGLGTVPLAKVAVGACLVGILLHRQIWSPTPLFSRAIPKLAFALFVLAAGSVLFSVWKSETLRFFFESVLVVAIGFVLTVKLADNRRALLVTLFVLVCAGLVQASAAYVSGRGRISAGDSYDPNDLAYLLVSVLPISVGFTVSAASAFRQRCFFLLSALLVFVTLLTQSRGGLLGLAAVTGYFIVRPIPRRLRANASPTKLGLVRRIAIAVLASIFVWTLLPAVAQERLATVLSLRSDYNTDTTLETGRLAIWERSTKATLARPIGFGLATFGVVDMQTGGRYKAAHNSVLQIFVELGFLGVFVYLRLYRIAWRGLSSPRGNDLSALVFCRCLQATLVGNFVSGFFLSQAYSSLLWTLFALLTLATTHFAEAKVDSQRRGRKSMTGKAR